MAFQVTATGKTTASTIHEANMQEIIKQQEKYYADRVGKQYGDFVVREVWYDWEHRRQTWKMQCVKCGEYRVTASGPDYVKGRNKGICGCERRIAREAEEKQRALRLEESARNSKWVGQTFGTWKVIGSRGYTKWQVECTKCGRTTWHRFNDVIAGTNPKCLCAQNQGKYDGSEWVGKRYGNITVKGYYKRHFIGICDCGRIVTVKPTFLFNGMQKTCGDPECQYHKKMNPSYKHGLSKERLWNIWRNMIDRCYNPKNQGRKYYLDRGITVCDEWRNDYLVFREWALTHGYREDLTIDRIDCDGNYEPGNCRWATYKEQAYNRHPNWTFTPKPNNFEGKRRIFWTINGLTKSAKEWCEQYNVSFPCAMYRIHTIGMTPYEALTVPKQQGRPHKHG